MNDRIRQAVRDTMKERGLTQEKLAEQMGVSRVYVNRMLTGDTSKAPGRWDDLLKTLGLELTVERKG